MLKNMTLGQYFPGDSLIHRLDPRTKLLATIALIAIVFVAQGFAGFALVAAFVLACAASTGIHLKFLIRGLKPIFFIIIFTFILNLFFQTGGTVLQRLQTVQQFPVGFLASASGQQRQQHDKQQGCVIQYLIFHNQAHQRVIL